MNGFRSSKAKETSKHSAFGTQQEDQRSNDRHSLRTQHLPNKHHQKRILRQQLYAHLNHSKQIWLVISSITKTISQPSLKTPHPPASRVAGTPCSQQTRSAAKERLRAMPRKASPARGLGGHWPCSWDLWDWLLWVVVWRCEEWFTLRFVQIS